MKLLTVLFLAILIPNHSSHQLYNTIINYHSDRVIKFEPDVEPFTVFAGVASAAAGYADSKKKDKQLNTIIDALNKFNARFDEVIDNIKQLGVQIDNKIIETYKTSVKNDLLGHIGTLDTYIKYPGGPDLDYLKPRFEVLTNIMMNQINDPAFFGVIGTAMVTHHDIFYLRRKIKNNKAQATDKFSKYHEYFEATTAYFDSLIQVKTPVNVNSKTRIGFLNPHPDYTYYVVFSFDVAITNNYQLSNFKFEGRDRRSERRDLLSKHHFYVELFEKKCACEEAFYNKLTKGIAGVNVDFFKRVMQPQWDDYLACRNKNKSDIEVLKKLREDAHQLAIIAARWKKDTYSDTEHLKSVK